MTLGLEGSCDPLEVGLTASTAAVITIVTLEEPHRFQLSRGAGAWRASAVVFLAILPGCNSGLFFGHASWY